MSDEEKKAIEIVKGITQDDLLNYWEGSEELYDAIQIILNLIEKQFKEIEELKEKNKNMIDPSKARLSYYDEGKGTQVVLEGFVSKEESEQKEKEAYKKGINIARELCNKIWENKIQAKKEEVNKKYKEIESNYTEVEIDDGDFELDDYVELQSIQYADDILHSLLKKE